MTQRFSAIVQRVVFVCVLMPWFSANAGQVVTSDYERAVTVMFWPQLYRNGGQTLYCRQPFDMRLGLSVEHIYALRWIERALDCADTDQCRAQELSFGYLESDLHNMFPTRMGTDHARGDFPFGFIPGDRRDFGQDCNFKVGPAWAYAQPQPEARGEIARALLYMMREYGLPLPERTSLELLRDWHHSDPPDAEDLRRNDEIERLQGNRNPFVDNPALADWFVPG